MVRDQIAARGVTDERVLEAMREVPREHFVPAAERFSAHDDRPLPIGYGATISQPYIVALMTEQLGLQQADRVLEVGAGCGYAAAVLGELCSHVVTIETVPELAAMARANLADRAGHIEVVEGDGSAGYPAQAPYDAISVTAGAPRVPGPLLEQLAPGGRLVIPVDARSGQELLLVTRSPDPAADGEDRFTREVITQVRFVPLVGKHAH
jgi:protein-L-isoaspartate(D-aspartate) O-methyltransferase